MITQVFPIGIPFSYYLMLNKHRDKIGAKRSSCNEDTKQLSLYKQASLEYLTSRDERENDDSIRSFKFLYNYYRPGSNFKTQSSCRGT